MPALCDTMAHSLYVIMLLSITFMKVTASSKLNCNLIFRLSLVYLNFQHEMETKSYIFTEHLTVSTEANIYWAILCAMGMFWTAKMAETKSIALIDFIAIRLTRQSHLPSEMLGQYTFHGLK